MVQGWVEHGFAPLIFEGWMMEIVKGRAVSRTATGYADVAVVVEAVVDLADYATGADAARLKSFAKFTARADDQPDDASSPRSASRGYADIKADPAIVPAGPQPGREQYGVQRDGPHCAPAARVTRSRWRGTRSGSASTST